MTDAKVTDMDEHRGKTVFDFLHDLLFDMLLKSEGRTTDMLETLMNEKMSVRVIAQERLEGERAGRSGAISGAPYYRRESILLGERSGFVVSHNIALVCSKYVPAPMFEALTAGREGIGKSIGALGLPTSRRMDDCGWRKPDEAVDLFQEPIKLYFAQKDDRTPFKQYRIHFEAEPGIYMLEYFNPNMIRHRLNEVVGKPG
ncbi:4-hydroxybenzoate synthetase [Paenibacillus sp. GYB003]|uniref:4-hydroxybenzoate synthetase n=1 Tax=Paenibacillus sp. GYB003 TaxID=2994392 RepID=UPI002F96E232